MEGEGEGGGEWWNQKDDEVRRRKVTFYEILYACG